VSALVSWVSPAQILAACSFVVVSTFCLCWFERSRRKTIKEILPKLQGTDPAAVREISRLLVSRRWQREAPSASDLEVTRSPPKEIEPRGQEVPLGDLAQRQAERHLGTPGP
jgi:hypothetical protein